VNFDAAEAETPGWDEKKGYGEETQDLERSLIPTVELLE